ncbi:MAG: large subunit ribosomal protein L9 [Paracoccaceae bacterium]|jgi:large subunit ribosomal protein L9
MQIILLERIAKLGQMGDVVNVKPGYARNFLLAKGKAMNATSQNLEAFKSKKSELETRNLETKSEAEAVSVKLEGKIFIIIRQASDSGSLYGSVSTRDAAEVATEAGFTLDRGQISLKRPIKELGIHEIKISLHPEVETTFSLNVARSREEAELQAKGRSVQELAAEAEAEAEFEISELFDDLGAAAFDESEPPINSEKSEDKE